MTAPPLSRATRRVLIALFVVWCLLIARLTLWPESVENQIFAAPFEPAGPGQLADASNFAGGSGAGAFSSSLVTLLPRPAHLEVAEIVANIVLFMPFGVLLVMVLGARAWWRVILIGIAASSAIELTQLIALPLRVPSLADVAKNSLGTALVVAIGLLAWRLLSRRAVSQPVAPTVPAVTEPPAGG